MASNKILGRGYREIPEAFICPKLEQEEIKNTFRNQENYGVPAPMALYHRGLEYVVHTVMPHLGLPEPYQEILVASSAILRM